MSKAFRPTDADVIEYLSRGEVDTARYIRDHPTEGLEGYPSIFRNKAGGGRVQGQLTREGKKEFEAARKRLAALAGSK